MKDDTSRLRALKPDDGRRGGTGLIYRSVLDSVASGVVSLDSRGVITSFNAAASEIVGVECEAVVGSSFAEIFAEREGADAFADTILDAVYESSMVQRVVEATFAGRTRTLSVVTRHLREERGDEPARLGIVAVFTDISELKELRESEVRLARELESQHAELRDAYRDLEETSRRLGRATKQTNAVRAVAALSVLALFVALGLYHWDAGAGLAPPAPDVPASDGAPGGAFLTVEPRPVSSSIALIGRLAPLREVEITSPIKGRVAAVHVRPGDQVSEGQRLVDMDVAEAEIERGEALVARIKARDRVTALENWSDHADVSRARRAVSKSSIALEASKNRIEETGFLLKRGIIPASEHEAAERELRSRRLDLQSAEQDLRAILAKGAAELDVAQLELDNANARLKSIEETLSRASVTAAAAGVVMRPGNRVADGEAAGSAGAGEELKRGASMTQGEHLLTIGDLKGVTVVGLVDEVDVTRLRPGQAATIAGAAFPGIELRGTVVRVSSQAAPRVAGQGVPLFEIAAAVESLTAEQRRALRLGMSATLEVVVYEKEDALLVPIDAVETAGGESHRLRVRDPATGEVRFVEVKTGITTVDSVEIVDGITAGDTIVLAGQ